LSDEAEIVTAGSGIFNTTMVLGGEATLQEEMDIFPD